MHFWREPRRQGEALRRSGQTAVDLYIFGHHNSYSNAFDLLSWDYDTYSYRPLNFRLVYNSGCMNFAEDRYFRENSETYIGHVGTNFGPIYSPILLQRWFMRSPVSRSLRTANRIVDRPPFTRDRGDTFDAIWESIRSFDRSIEENDPKGYLTGNASLRF